MENVDLNNIEALLTSIDGNLETLIIIGSMILGCLFFLPFSRLVRW